MHPLSQRIVDVLGLDPTAPAIQFERRWFTWGQLGAYADKISALVGTGRVPQDEGGRAEGAEQDDAAERRDRFR